MDDLDANPSTGSEADPVAMIEGILEREQEPAAPKKSADQKPEPEPEAEPAEPETETEEEGPADEDGGEETEKPDEQQEPEPELYTVKAGGEEIQVTRDELVRGYQRLSDYSRNIQQVAEQRKAVEAESQRIAAERAHYSQNLEQLSTILERTLPPAPPLEMSETDPIGYTQMQARHAAAVQQLQTVFAEKQRVQDEQAKYFAGMQQQTMQQAAQQLVEYVPEWKDPAKAGVEKRKVAEHLRTRGYTDAEIAQAADPRAIAMALDAMKYRELMASKPSVDQRLAKAPKVVKPGSGIAAPDKRKSLRSTIQRSGGTDMDAIAALIDLG